ncbi:MAG: hypothetical protein A2X13_14610 [Bacteroidetes bacterium GWC2_33_15]|nr:MAG: hypothetical protein A2X10_12655 [Bacteroidetes bacterium GWA2_33_15]OFX50104.1 MAG: hypothetical protein A2X13_14610 [Bacteroidetes bacterium GWC2_33_15]OFX65257.1 MAG: hypothetical protein A2X15_04185 [Bacteroidetes bacterium GWB2_32_14]OFX70483.1 MAG: hypothetical protein A2X14_04240 [Bacteroidetes bacterium GWD2_33_33]HAN19644.1 hypothetical protein [Bacteroidales bacterium]
MNTTTRRIIICTECHGEEFKTHNEFRGHTEGWWPVDVKCKDCNGTGKMIETITINHEPYVNKGIYTEYLSPI